MIRADIAPALSNPELQAEVRLLEFFRVEL